MDDKFKHIIGESEFISIITEINRYRDHGTMSRASRKLTESEIDQLKLQGNSSDNWNNIQVSEFFTPYHISNSRFYGRCFLGHFTGRDIDTGNNISLPTGIYDSIIKESNIGSESLVCRCGLVANYIVSTEAVLFENGMIRAGHDICFGNGRLTAIGPETGERSIKIFADMRMQTALDIISSIINPGYEEFINLYTESCTAKSGFIGRGCILSCNSSIRDSFIDSGTVISGSSLVSGCTILSSKDEPVYIGSGVFLQDSLIQHGCHIDAMTSVRGSLIMEHSEIENHAKINESIIGHDSSVAGGEITSTFAGPFTAAHHQSLLIACIWPAGRGNIGYGANVGSNHTSRLPDQEIFPGEGVFFGLGSSIKFPSNFSQSPYSVIATGTVTSPQKLEFPFSLITGMSVCCEEIPAFFNELLPGWMLHENLYSILRNESKYRKRIKARRNNPDLKIFRSDIIDMMVSARTRLESISAQKTFYTDDDIPGAGKNCISERARTMGIAAYTFFVRYYALESMMRRIIKIASSGMKVTDSTIYSKDNATEYWSHAMDIIISEGLNVHTPAGCIEMFIHSMSEMKKYAVASREKDYLRGIEIIDDYASYHANINNDLFLIELNDRIQIDTVRLRRIMEQL